MYARRVIVHLLSEHSQCQRLQGDDHVREKILIIVFRNSYYYFRVAERKENFDLLHQRVFSKINFKVPDEDVEAIINCNPGSVEETLYSLMRHLKKFESGEMRLSPDEIDVSPSRDANDLSERKNSQKSESSDIPGSPKRILSARMHRHASDYGSELSRTSSVAADDRGLTKKSSKHVDIERKLSAKEFPATQPGDVAKLTSKNMKKTYRGENRDLLKEMITQKEMDSTRARALTDASRVLEPIRDASHEGDSSMDSSDVSEIRSKLSRSNTMYTGEHSPKHAVSVREKDKRIKELEEKLFLMGLELEKLQQIVKFKDAKIESLEERLRELETETVVPV